MSRTGFAVRGNRQAQLTRVSCRSDPGRAGGDSDVAVLVIDDDRDFADGLAEMLDLLGYRTVTAYSAADGVEIALNERIGLVLIDIGLPGRNGAECAADIAAVAPDANCVLMTGYNAETISRMGVQAGALTILRKPLKPEDLSRVLPS